VITLRLPGQRPCALRSLVLDFNGTLAADGVLLAGVRSRIAAVAKVLDVHVVTGDTFGTVRSVLRRLDLHVEVLPPLRQAAAKERYVVALGPGSVCAIGNGNNDAAMLKRAALSIAVIGREGCAEATIRAADLVVRDVIDGLELLTHPKRLVASLRT
jgi:P-type E1-E2 ATPase